MESITIEELKRLIPNINIIDIRDRYSYYLGHIPTALNIPSSMLINMPEYYLDKEKKYYIYCEYGLTSFKICKILKEKGYNVVNVEKGYDMYKRV